MNLPAPIARNLYPVLAGLALRSGSLPYNTMITNVVVKQAPLYLAGARLIRVLPTGPVIDQSGLFHAVFSFDGEVTIAFTACREMLPDPRFYAECIDASFDDLKRATLGARSAKTGRKKAAARKKKTRKSQSTGAAARATKKAKATGKSREKPAQAGDKGASVA